MSIPILLVKITGFVLLLWTGRSIFKHLQERQRALRAPARDKQDEQSVSEQVLNNLLLYLWLAFMVVFSVGMIVNN